MSLKCIRLNWVFKHHLVSKFFCVDTDAICLVYIWSKPPGLLKEKLKLGSCGITERLQELLQSKLPGCVVLGKLFNLSEP